MQCSYTVCMLYLELSNIYSHPLPAEWSALNDFFFGFFGFLQHGRVKIKSTAQQEEEKRKEREKKLKIYVAARDACFSKVL